MNLKTRNTSVFPVRYILVIIWFFFTGCAVHPGFRSYNAATPREALDELLLRRDRIIDINAKATFEFTHPTGQYRLNAVLNYAVDSGWRIEINGPLGVQLAVIETDDNQYVVYQSFAAQSTRGQLSDSLVIPELGLFIPHLDYMLSALLPTVDISGSDGWRIEEAEIGKGGFLLLSRDSGSGLEEVILQMDFVPLRVGGEERRVNDLHVFHRILEYDDESRSYPRTITIFTGQLILKVDFKSVSINLLQDRVTVAESY